MNATASSRDPQGLKPRAFVVNLCASTTPVALPAPEGEEFAAYRFFVTRRSEEGRERFRLHMGYFASLAEARDKVEDLRKRYPTAWAGPAPHEVGAPEASQIDDTLVDLSNVREVLAALDAGEGAGADAILWPTQELSLLETGRLPDRHFAVQLVWSERPIDLSAQPQPALFDVYTLYHVEGTREGKRWYGLRLGFFNDVDAAKRVACYLKPDFSSVVVVPVTLHERERASGEPYAESPPAPKPAPAATMPAVVSPSPLVDPFQPEPSLLPVRLGHTVEAVTRKTEPFELLPLAARQRPGASPAAPSAKPSAVAIAKAAVGTAGSPRKPGGKRVMTRRVAEPGRAAPDTATLECLGASALDVADERRAEPKARPIATDPSASAIRSVFGFGKWFGRRSA